MKVKHKFKKKILRFTICIIVPILLSFYLFNPFFKYEIQCSKSCLGHNSTFRIIDVSAGLIRSQFVTNVVEKIFDSNQEYDFYNLKITDLSYLSKPELIKLDLIASFQGNHYTIPYQKSYLLHDVHLNKSEYFVLQYNLNPIKGDVEAQLMVDYKLVFSRPITEFIFKMIVFIIAWIAIIHLVKDTARYVNCKENFSGK